MIDENDIKTIKDNRLMLMGISALMIMFFHFPFNFCGGLDYVHSLSYFGVDIFMFLSGLSMHNSFVIGSNRNKKLFYSKRIARIIPKYVAIVAIGIILDSFTNNTPLLQYINKGTVVATLQYIITYRWFIPCIFLAYVYTPTIDRFLRFKIKSGIVRLILIISLLIVTSFIFLGKSTILMAWVRWPLYVIGYFYSDYVPNRKLSGGGKTCYRIYLL